MTAKKKASPARDGDALDVGRPWKVEPILPAPFGLQSQEPNTFGNELSTGSFAGPFSCPLDAHICTHELDAENHHQAIEEAAKKGLPKGASVDPPSSLVIRPSSIQAPRRTASPQGLTVAELRRMAGATRFLFDRSWKLLHVTVAGHSLDARAFDAMLRRFKSRVADAQRRGKMRTGMYVEVRETSCSTHSHFIIAGTPVALRTIRRLEEAFGLDVDGNSFVNVTTVYDVDGLLAYLGKEANGWACQVVGRKYQRHASRAIGDRVRLGRGLKAAMLAAGDLEPYKRTYATPTAAKVAKRRASIPREASTNPRRMVDDTMTEEAAPYPPAPLAASRVEEEVGDRDDGQQRQHVGDELARRVDFSDGGEERRRVHKRAPRWPSSSIRRRLVGSLIQSPRKRTAPASARRRGHGSMGRRRPRLSGGGWHGERHSDRHSVRYRAARPVLRTS